ncbi:MAG TPA: SCO1664 family protein, partial [Thermomicrobiales bacterium]|nr:SCO1664 family protein [Thermomicrobiales bacterium]
MPDLYLQIEDSDAMLEGSSEYCEESALAILESGEIIGQKMIPWGSNYSFAAAVQTEAGDETLAIYKPASGENPLWDFPDGTLYKREVASYRLVRLLGWPMIPPTVIHNGPLGPGSLQLYRHPMEPDPVTDSSDFWGTPHPAIEQMVLFDHIANNADRKLSHCLRDRSGRPWGIDHGLTFNVDFKLRTVLWQYVGHPISEQLLVDLARVRADEATLRT